MSNDHPEQPNRLARRLLVVKAGSAAALTVAGVAVAPTVAEAQRSTDRDPNDAEGRGRGGRGSSDNDPRDAAGRSRSITDRDPTDGEGRGRGR